MTAIDKQRESGSSFSRPAQIRKPILALVALTTFSGFKGADAAGKELSC